MRKYKLKKYIRKNNMQDFYVHTFTINPKRQVFTLIHSYNYNKYVSATPNQISKYCYFPFLLLKSLRKILFAAKNIQIN